MSGMKYPKMILFDYGRTLAYEPGWDSLRGNAALLRYAVKNDDSYTAEDVGKVAKGSTPMSRISTTAVMK